jgi:hypothetical protein
MYIVFFSFVLCWGWTQGLQLEPLHSASSFLWWDFWDGVLRTIWPGWLWTTILLISASWVAGITGVSHWFLAKYIVLSKLQKRKIALFLFSLQQRLFIAPQYPFCPPVYINMHFIHPLVKSTLIFFTWTHKKAQQKGYLSQPLLYQDS